MQINPLTNNPYYSQGLPGKASESKGNGKNDQTNNQDKLELSPEAMKMQNLSPEDKKLNDINNKISNNFYNSEEVINKVANNILKELQLQ